MIMKTILIAASNFTTKISKFLRFHYALYSNLPDPPRNLEGSSKKYSPHSDDLALGDALLVFDKMLERRPLPAIENFTKLLSSVVRLKQYSTAISMIHRLRLLGPNPLVKPDIYAFHVAINCFCHSHQVRFGFSVLGNVIKLGYEPNCPGFLLHKEMSKAISMLERMRDCGFSANAYTSTLVVELLTVRGLDDSCKEALEIFIGKN
ncbi:hypothetical protein L1887_16310 [Cichorium endivia]|nr:hypothetical protein L1887_16310 [Cichorium endivia]